MIDVKCKDDDSKTEEKSIYPCIKIHETNGRKVLFIAPRNGYQMDKADGDRSGNFMHHSTMWTEDLYTLYPGTIELKNG